MVQHVELDGLLMIVENLGQVSIHTLMSPLLFIFCIPAQFLLFID